MVRAVSVYRVSALGAAPSHAFGTAFTHADHDHAIWLGWLPLTLVGFAGPDIALADDGWLTAAPGRSGDGCVRPGDLVSPADAASELRMRRHCRLDAYTVRSGDHRPGGRLCESSLALSVADDVVARVDRLRAAHEVWVESVRAVEGEAERADGSSSGAAGDSPARQRCGRAVRALQEQRHRLHVLLAAAVQIRVFDPAAAGR